MEEAVRLNSAELASTEADTESLPRCEHALELLLTHRGNPSAEVDRVLANDPQCVFAHCLRTALIVCADEVALRDHHLLRPPSKRRARTCTIPRAVNGKYVFPSVGKKTGYLAEPKFFFNQIALKTGIKVSAHDLRRTFITTAESCDISPIALKALVNHSLNGKNDVTEGYVIIAAERLRDPAQKVTDKLKALCQS